MPKVVIRARYQDEQAVKAELLKIFPTAVMGIKFTRDRFQCDVPRVLTEEETGKIQSAIEHYARPEDVLAENEEGKQT